MKKCDWLIYIYVYLIICKCVCESVVENLVRKKKRELVSDF